MLRTHSSTSLCSPACLSEDTWKKNDRFCLLDSYRWLWFWKGSVLYMSRILLSVARNRNFAIWKQYRNEFVMWSFFNDFIFRYALTTVLTSQWIHRWKQSARHQRQIPAETDRECLKKIYKWVFIWLVNTILTQYCWLRTFMQFKIAQGVH